MGSLSWLSWLVELVGWNNTYCTKGSARDFKRLFVLFGRSLCGSLKVESM